MALIMAAGLDEGKNGGIELSVQVYTPSQASGGGGGLETGGADGTGGGQVIVQSIRGADFADAAAKLQEQLPRQVFWGHSEVYVLGEQLARKGVLDQIDFLFRHPQPRERAHVFVSKGKAKDILSMSTRIERDSSEALRELSNLSMGMGITMKDLNQMLTGRSKAAVLPLIEIKREQGSDYSFPVISGVAVLKDGKLAGEFNEDVRRETQLIRGELNVLNMTFPVEGKKEEEEGLMSVRIIKSRAKLVPEICGDRWRLTVLVEGEAVVQQNESAVDVTKPEELPRLEKLLTGSWRKKWNRPSVRFKRKAGRTFLGRRTRFGGNIPGNGPGRKADWNDIFRTSTYLPQPRFASCRRVFPGKACINEGKA
ncbi:hypothetical protein HMSSN036_13990 [Paenibacillus macerans]|nr:hypothetical protein HMSSN036_13990 [Paenibacillus macerans]